MRNIKRLTAFLLMLVLVGSSVPMPVHAATETAYFPMDYLAITQGINGSYSHQGTYAIDLAGKDKNRDVVYAPFTGVVKKLYTKSGNFVWLESKEKVRYADGTLDYMTIMIGHDDDISDLSVGKTIPQGTVFYREGTAGNATGNHVHLEVARGKYRTGGWYENEYGIWELYNAIPPYDALVLKSSTIRKKDYGYNWRTEPDTTTYTDITEGNYYLKNVGTGQYLTVSNNKDADRQNVVGAAFADSTGQRLAISKASGAYKMRPHCSSGRIINCYAVTVANGTNVNLLAETAGDPTQLWLFEATNGGYFIHNKQSPSCVLAIVDGNACTSTKTGASNQIWVLERICKHSSTKIINRREPGCLTFGYSGDTVCADCGKVLSVGTDLVFLSHSYAEQVVRPLPGVQGYTLYTCTRCGDSYKDSYTDYHPYLRGDVDRDGTVTSTDARLVLQFYAGKIGPASLDIAVADVDLDGSFTSTDARLILQKYAGKIKDFPG